MSFTKYYDVPSWISSPNQTATILLPNEVRGNGLLTLCWLPVSQKWNMRLTCTVHPVILYKNMKSTLKPLQMKHIFFLLILSLLFSFELVETCCVPFLHCNIILVSFQHSTFARPSRKSFTFPLFSPIALLGPSNRGRLSH